MKRANVSNSCHISSRCKTWIAKKRKRRKRESNAQFSKILIIEKMNCVLSLWEQRAENLQLSFGPSSLISIASRERSVKCLFIVFSCCFSFLDYLMYICFDMLKVNTMRHWEHLWQDLLFANPILVGISAICCVEWFLRYILHHSHASPWQKKILKFIFNTALINKPSLNTMK